MSFYALFSPRIIQVLKLLDSGVVNKNELKEKLNVSISRVSQILNKAENLGLVEVSGNYCKMTSKGYLLLNVYEVIEGFEKLCEIEALKEYDFQDIPPYLMDRLYMLENARLTEKCCDFFCLEKAFINAVRDAKRIKGYANVFFPEYVDVFLEAANSKSIEIVVSRGVLEELLSKHVDKLKIGISKPNVKLYISNRSYKFSFIVTENNLIIYFYLKNGIFDYRRALVCKDANCVEWGEQLYIHVLKNSKIFKL